MKVQLLDLSRQYKKIRKDLLKVICQVSDSGHYVLGPNVSALEAEVAKYCGANYAVGCASGTDALLLALMAYDVGPGDSVITTPFTFFATAGSIARLGAKTIFVDIDPKTYNMDPGALEAALKKGKKGIKAIIPIHLYGQCADMDAINKIARRYRVPVIEDAAQSIGAEYKGKRAGALGEIGCFSFYPTKNLGCMGDGGMLTTNSPKLFEKLKMLRVHGSKVRYYHDLVGANSRLDEMQAAILRVKLGHLDKWAEGRRMNARRYDDLFKKAGLDGLVALPHISNGNVSVYNQYVVRVKDRDALREHLRNNGVGTEVYYPLSLHMQKCFKGLGYKKGDFPVSEKAAKDVLALPIYPELKKEEVACVVSSIARFYGK